MGDAISLTDALAQLADAKKSLADITTERDKLKIAYETSEKNLKASNDEIGKLQKLVSDTVVSGSSTPDIKVKSMYDAIDDYVLKEA